LRERSESNSTPRLRAWVEGRIEEPRKDKDGSRTLDLCCWVPIRRYSVLDGLTVRRFKVSQEYTASRVEDKMESLVDESELEKEI
jgi:hypothetical protein